jgi:hypothetical protein
VLTTEDHQIATETEQLIARWSDEDAAPRVVVTREPRGNYRAAVGANPYQATIAGYGPTPRAALEQLRTTVARLVALIESVESAPPSSRTSGTRFAAPHAASFGVAARAGDKH